MLVAKNEKSKCYYVTMLLCYIGLSVMYSNVKSLFIDENMTFILAKLYVYIMQSAKGNNVFFNKYSML